MICLRVEWRRGDGDGDKWSAGVWKTAAEVDERTCLVELSEQTIALRRRPGLVQISVRYTALIKIKTFYAELSGADFCRTNKGERGRRRRG